MISLITSSTTDPW